MRYSEKYKSVGAESWPGEDITVTSRPDIDIKDNKLIELEADFES